MDAADTRTCLSLHSLPQLDDSTLRSLLLHYGGPGAIRDSDWGEWPALGLSSLPPSELRRMRRFPEKFSALALTAQADALAAVDALILPLTDARYPALLRTIHDPPPLLYVRGDPAVMQTATLAVVGSRRASPAGLRLAQSLSASAASVGLTIASGLALGIDGAAHRGALQVGAAGVAIMATGIEQVYPRRHRELAEQLVTAGCLATEFAPGVRPLRQNFPRRNRLISGLSLAVLVVEAALPSGSLITAGTALEQGREVLAVPWSPCHPGGAGCLRLLRDGAKMVQGVDDILDELGPLSVTCREWIEPAPTEPVRLPAGQRRLLALVGYEAVSADQLASHSGLPVAQVLAELSALEMEGLVMRSAGGYIHA